MTTKRTVIPTTTNPRGQLTINDLHEDAQEAALFWRFYLPSGATVQVGCSRSTDLSPRARMRYVR